MGKIVLIGAGYKCKNDKLGIGYNNTLPWKCPEDLVHFKELTKDNIIIMGRKTFQSIGSKPLKDRLNIVLTKDSYDIINNEINLEFYNSIDKLNSFIKNTEKTVYVIGGNEIYNLFIDMDNIDSIILTEIFSEEEIKCDTYFPDIPWNYFLSEYTEKKQSVTKGISYRIMFYINKNIENPEPLFDIQYKQQKKYKSSEFEYLNVIKDVLRNGNVRPDRTGVGTVSLFGKTMRFDIFHSIPVLTTKKVPWKMAIEELLWMLSGSTDTKILEQKGINIWKGNTSKEFLKARGLDYPEGQLYYGYGHQIRNAGGIINEKDGTLIEKGFDQLMYVENELKTNPFSRRILWNLWTAKQIDKMPLAPCHYALQVYVEEINNIKYLSGMLSQRSQDEFIGCPWNIIFYSTLIYILAIKCDMIPKELIINIGDAHIYSNHVNQVTEQLSRSVKSQPVLKVNKDIKNKDYKDITIEDFDLIGYYPHPRIKAPMAI